MPRPLLHSFALALALSALACAAPLTPRPVPAAPLLAAPQPAAPFQEGLAPPTCAYGAPAPDAPPELAGNWVPAVKLAATRIPCGA